MKDLIEELDLVMKEKNLSPENASKFIQCSFKQTYNWLNGISKPSLIYRKALRCGINRMKRLTPMRMSGLLEDRGLYRELSGKITIKEKIWLLDSDGDYSVYREKLKELAKRYGIPIKEIEEK